MATRPSKTNNTGALDLAEVFKVLASFDVTQDEPVSTEDFALELGVTPSEAFNALDSLADAELVDASGRGLAAEWWINVPDVSEDNAIEIAREALSDAVTVTETPSKPQRKSKAEKDAEYAERTAYNAAVSASQEPGSQHLHPMEDARPEPKNGTPVPRAEFTSEGVKPLPAVTPVIAENGEKVTIPVDFDDPSKGRRELDASKGEKLLSEDTFTVKVTPETVVKSLDPEHPITPQRLPEKGLDQFIDAETGDMVYESSIEKNGLKLDEPAEIPPVPAGVNPNVWDLAHTAITQTARDYWKRAAAADALEYEENNGQPAPF